MSEYMENHEFTKALYIVCVTICIKCSYNIPLGWLLGHKQMLQRSNVCIDFL